jgi:NADH-quinone oxidoreductase subunit E
MENFVFNEKNLDLATKMLAKYPTGKRQSALVPLLDLAQRQNNGWLSESAIEYVADYIGVSYVKALEVASFYSMFNLKPVGKYHIQVCGTTPCWLNGAKETLNAFEKDLGIKVGGCTSDNLFSLLEVECLGACIKAPVVQINDDYYENVKDIDVSLLVEKLKNNN